MAEPNGLALYVSLTRLPKNEVGDIDWEEHFNKFPSIELFIRDDRFTQEGLFEWLNRWKDLLFFQFKLDSEHGQKADLYDELVTVYQKTKPDSYENRHYLRLLIWYERQRNSPETRPFLAEMMMKKIDLLWNGVSKERIEEIRRRNKVLLESRDELDLLYGRKRWISMHDQLRESYQLRGKLPRSPETKLYQWYIQQKKLPRSDFRRILVDYIGV